MTGILGSRSGKQEEKGIYELKRGKSKTGMGRLREKKKKESRRATMDETTLNSKKVIFFSLPYCQKCFSH